MKRICDMKGFRLGLFAACAAMAMTAQARVCAVSDFESVAGCEKGDEVLFTPESYNAEQLTLQFIARKCDLSKPVNRNSAGVVCVYAGNKEIVDGAKRLAKRRYQSVIDKAVKGKWLECANSYWKKTEEGRGDEIEPGDIVVMETVECEHDANGKETEGRTVSQRRFAIEKGHCVYLTHPRSGARIERVSEGVHEFIRIEKLSSNGRRRAPKARDGEMPI